MPPMTHTTTRLDDEVLAELDDVARRLGWSRSQALNVLLRVGLRVVAEADPRVEELLATALQPRGKSKKPRKPRR